MADHGITESTALATIVNALVLETLYADGVLINTITDYSRFVQPGCKAINVPKLTSLSAVAKVENTAATPQAMTGSVVAINFEPGQTGAFYYNVPARLEDIAVQQSGGIDLKAEYISNMAKAMVAGIESSIMLQLVKAANDIQLSGTNNLLVTKVDILEMRQFLLDNKVPRQDLFLAIPPAQEAAILNIADFVKANEYGNASAIQNGVIGKLFGVNVVISNAFDSDSEAILYHKSAVGFAFAQNTNLVELYQPLYLATDMNMSANWGVRQLDASRICYADESAES